MQKTIDQRNRENAQHSTGPQTEQGKAKSAQNARRHGLSSSTLWIPDNVKPEFQSLHRALHQEIRPIGELQMQFFEQLVHAAWQQNIARDRLAKAQAEGDERREATSHRYLRQYERSYASALKEIRNLQADLAIRAAAENLPIALLPESYDTAKITREINKIANLTERTQRPQQRYALLTQIGNRFLPLLYPELAATTNPPTQEAAA